jgi:hypothetical protein
MQFCYVLSYHHVKARDSLRTSQGRVIHSPEKMTKALTSAALESGVGYEALARVRPASHVSLHEQLFPSLVALWSQLE